MSLFERVLGLPFWSSLKHPEFKPLLDIQKNREQARSELIHSLLDRGRNFFNLRGEQLKKVDEALIAGDRNGRVWSDDELRKNFKLGPEGKNGNFCKLGEGSVNWPAVRQALDDAGYNGWLTDEGGGFPLPELSKRFDLILAGKDPGGREK